MITAHDVGVGRELDALVAEKVMGWTWLRHRDWPKREQVFAEGPPDGEYWVEVPKGERRADVRDAGMTSVPHYSTSIADAWKIIDRLMQDNFMVSVNCSHESDWWCCVYPPSGLHIESEFARSAPEAICLAALEAVRRTPDTAQS